MILSALFNKHNWTIPTSWGYKVFTTLDFGCGDNPRNPFAGQSLFGLDIVGKESPNLNLTKNISVFASKDPFNRNLGVKINF